MGISVFLSYPAPYMARQHQFVERIRDYLRDRGLEPRTLGVTDYDMDAPLTAIRRLMRESNGVITIAFRRAMIAAGTGKPQSDLDAEAYDLSGKWLTSPWSHIEPAMAFQLGLPILVLREAGVVDDGILERGVMGLYLPEFDLDSGHENYLDLPEWKQIIAKWESRIRQVAGRKGQPPALY